jgi:predicted nucleic acid-binding protein
LAGHQSGSLRPWIAQELEIMRIFWDTNLFVYLWEGSVRTRQVETLINWQHQHEAELVTSTLTIGELLVHPLRQDREDLADRYLASFSQLHVVPFDQSAAYAFAQLRARYARLAPPDAIQLGCASVATVDLFITNDRRLARYTVPRVKAIRALADLEVARI